MKKNLKQINISQNTNIIDNNFNFSKTTNNEFLNFYNSEFDTYIEDYFYYTNNNSKNIIWDSIYYNSNYNIKSNFIFIKNYNTLVKFYNSKLVKYNLGFDTKYTSQDFENLFYNYKRLFSKQDPNYDDLKFINNFNDYCIDLASLKNWIINSPESIQKNRQNYIILTNKVFSAYYKWCQTNNSSTQNIDINCTTLTFKFSKNNIIGVLNSNKNQVIDYISAGRLKYKGKKKTSILAAKEVANWLILLAIKKGLNKNNRFNIKYKGWSRIKRRLTYFLMRKRLKKQIRLYNIIDKLSLPHNGCRAKKKMRK